MWYVSLYNDSAVKLAQKEDHMRSHAEEAALYQQDLEGRRGLTEWDDHDLKETVEEDLAKAKQALEVAWLREQVKV